MAGNAVIGALRVTLGLDSAQFEAGLKKSQASLSGFGKVAAVGFAAAATAAIAAGTALAFAGKKAIDTADNMSKAAQKVGVATEALSRLNYAAGYSDVSLEQLSGGLEKLSKNLADVASGKGGSAATALQMLGISATDSTGKLRDADVVFADIADRFGRLEDGSTKTALAMQLFGKTGAELIPLLNTGRDGLAAMADESDRLGLTVSTKTGRAAEQFNDTLTKVGRIVEGVAMQVAEAALPALQDLADILASPEFASAAQSLGSALVGAFNLVVQAVVQTTNAVQGFLDWLASKGTGVGGVGGATVEELTRRIANSKRILNDPGNAGQDMSGLRATLAQEEAALAQLMSTDPIGSGASFGQLSGFGFGTGSTGGSLTLPTFGDTAGGDAMASRLEALRASLATEEEAEKESFEKRREEIQKFYDDGIIQRGEYDELLLRAQQDHADKMTEIAKKQAEEETRLREQLVSNVANIFGSISTILENMGDKNLAAAKAFAVAEAIINTAQGITKALAQGGIFGFVGAAAVAAAGIAQISTILSTQKGSGTKPSVKGSGTAVAAVEPASEGPSAPTVNLTLVGGGRYSRDELKQLFNDMNDAMGDGMKLNVGNA